MAGGGGLPRAQEASPEAAVPLLLAVKLSRHSGLSFCQSPAYRQMLQKIKSICLIEGAIQGGRTSSCWLVLLELCLLRTAPSLGGQAWLSEFCCSQTGRRK